MRAKPDRSVRVFLKVAALCCVLALHRPANVRPLADDPFNARARARRCANLFKEKVPYWGFLLDDGFSPFSLVEGESVACKVTGEKIYGVALAKLGVKAFGREARAFGLCPYFNAGASYEEFCLFGLESVAMRKALNEEAHIARQNFERATLETLVSLFVLQVMRTSEVALPAEEEPLRIAA